MIKQRYYAGRQRIAGFLALAAWLVAASGTVPAAIAAELIVNGSFENTGGTFVDGGGSVMNLPPGAASIPGWTPTDNALAWVSNANTYGARTPYGDFLIDLTGSQDNGSLAGITQTLGTAPSQLYRLSLSLGAYQDNPLSSGQKSVLVTAGAASTSFTFTPVGSGNLWGSFSFDFLATSTSTPITIKGTSTGTGTQYLGLDNVSVVGVPEPSAAILLSGGLSLTARRRRRK
jgi:hypothetical protein